MSTKQTENTSDRQKKNPGKKGTAREELPSPAISPKLKAELEKDLGELKKIFNEITQRATKQVFNGASEAGERLRDAKKIDSSAEPLDTLLQFTVGMKDAFAVSAAEAAAFSYCIEAFSDSLKGLSGEDILLFQKAKLALARILNDSTHAIRMLRATEPQSYKELIGIFEKTFAPTGEKGKGGIAGPLRDFMVSGLDDKKPEPKKINALKDELIDMLLQFQVIVGIVLKWSFLAEEEFVSQVSGEVKKADWNRIYRDFVTPVIETVLSMNGKT